MNVSLTPELAEFINQRIETGLYQSASEVVREGLRLLEERERHKHLFFESQAELEMKLLDGFHSGRSALMTEVDWSNLRKRIIGRPKTVPE